MLFSQQNAWDHPCQTVFYRDRLAKREQLYYPHSLLYIDMRPGREHLYQGKLQALQHRLNQGKLEISAEDKQLLSTLLSEGLSTDWFLDTKVVSVWLGAMNYYANFSDFDLPPLELVVAHAESHISSILQQLEQIRPAGIVLSGSPKMLTEVCRDPITQDTCQCTRFCLNNHIPILGICFGMHLLGYERFLTRPDWLTVPPDMNVEFHNRLRGAFSNCQPESRRMIYGSRMVRRLMRHPIMNQVDKMLGLKVHSQHFWPGHPAIPTQAILAESSRYFRHSSQTKKRYQLTQKVIEVLSCGPLAIGTQLHPELTPQLLMALTYTEEFQQSLLAEGHDLAFLRQEINDYPQGYFAGQRLGYNFCKRIMMPRYVTSLPISKHSQETILQRLVEKEPTLTLP